MNKHEAASLVAIIAAAYPQWPASKETISLYVEGLLDLDYESAAETIREIIFTEERWPSVAGIRRRLAERARLLSPVPADAWAEVSSQASIGGRLRSPAWSSDAISATVLAIGWRNICSSTNYDTIRAQFLRLYEDYRKQFDQRLLAERGRLALNGKRNDHITEATTMAIDQ